MNDTLRVNHHFNLLGACAKQPVRLDHLQPFVHHGGRVNRYFSTHTPVGMCDRLLRRDALKAGDITIKKWATRCSEQDFTYAMLRWHALITDRQALEDCVVLAVNRQQGCAARRDCIHEQLPRDNEGFLVGEQ